MNRISLLMGVQTHPAFKFDEMPDEIIKDNASRQVQFSSIH